MSTSPTSASTPEMTTDAVVEDADTGGDRPRASRPLPAVPGRSGLPVPPGTPRPRPPLPVEPSRSDLLHLCRPVAAPRPDLRSHSPPRSTPAANRIHLPRTHIHH